MRVLVVHPSAQLYGADRMTEVSVNAFTKRGHTVAITVPIEGPLVDRLERTGAAVEVLDTPVLRKSNLTARGVVALVLAVLTSTVTIGKAVRRHRPDVIYVNSIIQPWWIAVGKLFGRPVVVHVREAETGVSRLLQRCIYGPLLLADKVLCNSQSTRTEITRVFPRLAGRSRVIYNGKDWSPYEVERDAGGDAAEPSGLRILLVGRLNPRKGQDIAFHALADLVARGTTATLTLAGDVFPGYEWYEDDLRKLARSLRIDDRVHFAGFQNNIAKVLGEADVAVVPSRVEPFGTVAAECMAACLPTVVADIEGLAEIVCSDDIGLTFPPGDHESLARQFERLAADPAESRAMALRGRESVLERFSLDRYESEISSYIEGLRVGGRP